MRKASLAVRRGPANADAPLTKSKSMNVDKRRTI
jgi:hypothetical protein